MAAVLVLAAAGCTTVQSAVMPAVAELSGSVDGLAVVHGPPDGAAAAAEASAVRGPWSDERIAQARADNRFDPFTAFAPVMGDGFTAEAYPLTDDVFDRMLAPIGASINLAKDRYGRERPFEMDAALTTCIAPSDGLRASGSYPSGHAGFGWAWALVLAELLPARADAILQRGRDYGDSRVVCALHYPSDVEAGRTIAAAGLARLHADPAFRRALDAARAELARAEAN